MTKKIKRFEDLIAWQKARDFARAIYLVTGEGEFSKDFGLRNQIQRAAVSVMSNLAEGFERGGTTEFHRFVVTAKASCAEVRSQLYLASDIGYLKSDVFENLLEQSNEISRILGGLRTTLASKK